MREYLEPMLGTTGALIAQFAVTLAAILILVLIVFWLIRRFTGGRFGTGNNRSRQPRLSLLDALPIDQRRRLVLVRRDNVEHLLLIGGPTDVVVEATIHRPPPAQRRAESQQMRPAPAGPARPTPQGPGDAQRAASLAMENRRTEPPAMEAPPAEPEIPAMRPEEAAPAEPAEALPPAEHAARPARGPRSFLGGGRSRQEPPAEPPRREVRGRPAEAPRGPQRAAAPQPVADAETTEAETPAAPPPRGAPSRGSMPPAPPIEPPSLDDGPFGAPHNDVAPSQRHEPVFERPAQAEPEPARHGETVRHAGDARRAPPVVEPPTREDQPVAIDEAFAEEPSASHREPKKSDEPASPTETERPQIAHVGDLEKEMARLLGEISGGKR